MNKDYNKFDPELYSERDYGTIKITSSEARKWYEMKLASIDENEKLILGDPLNTMSIQKRSSFATHLDSLRESALKDYKDIESLGYEIFAPVDYYFERYMNLRKFDKVDFAITGAFEHPHPVKEISETLLLFIEDEIIIDRLNMWLNEDSEHTQYMADLGKLIEDMKSGTLKEVPVSIKKKNLLEDGSDEGDKGISPTQ